MDKTFESMNFVLSKAMSISLTSKLHKPSQHILFLLMLSCTVTCNAGILTSIIARIWYGLDWEEDWELRSKQVC